MMTPHIMQVKTYSVLCKCNHFILARVTHNKQIDKETIDNLLLFETLKLPISNVHAYVTGVISACSPH